MLRRATRADLRIDASASSLSAQRLIAFRRGEQVSLDSDADLNRLLLASLPQHAAISLDSSGTIIRWTAGAEQMFGYRSSEVVGRSYAFLFALADAAQDETPSLPCELSGGRREFEATFVRCNGSTFPVGVTLQPYADDESEPHFALLIHDVTERNRIEELLRSRFAETAHLARLSTIGQMTAELAHEINQPLAAAANYARACANFGRSGRYVVAPEAIEWMERSAAQALRAVQISKRLGAFVRKEDGTRSWIQINTLVEQTVQLTRSMMFGHEDSQAPIEVRTDFDPSAPELFADPVQVEQVLLNLVRNAIEAMHELKTRSHVLKLRTAVDSNFVTITVADTGPGVAPDKLADLFDPFFTTKPSGLGLGLSISRAIVEQHGGRMTVESSSAGTAFSFTLPLSPGGPSSC